MHVIQLRNLTLHTIHLKKNEDQGILKVWLMPIDKHSKNMNYKSDSMNDHEFMSLSQSKKKIKIKENEQSRDQHPFFVFFFFYLSRFTPFYHKSVPFLLKKKWQLSTLLFFYPMANPYTKTPLLLLTRETNLRES